MPPRRDVPLTLEIGRLGRAFRASGVELWARSSAIGIRHSTEAMGAPMRREPDGPQVYIGGTALRRGNGDGAVVRVGAISDRAHDADA